MHDRILDRLTLLATTRSPGHHPDHRIGGDAVGWPVTDRAHGKPIVMALVWWAGEIDGGERAVARFGGLATPFADTVRPMPRPELDQIPEGGSGPDHEAVRSLFLDAVELPTEEAMAEHLRASTQPLAVAELRLLGGRWSSRSSLGSAAAATGRLAATAWRPC